jgi:sigma-E factor negative regulatory protein RseC
MPKKMQTKKAIEHTGVIRHIEGSTARIVFEAHSACSTCHASGVCSVAGREEKSVDITHDGNVILGEKVKVVLKQSLGYKALLLGYLIPFLIVLCSLVLFSSLFDSEALAGIYSLSLLIPYYLAIYLLRKKIRREFSFTIRKLN